MGRGRPSDRRRDSDKATAAGNGHRARSSFAASYPDEVIRRHDHAGQFSPWHYVNWPVDAAEYDQSVCKPDCILQELPKQIAALQNPDLQAKALALSWVIHLVGDLHQPLHVADRFVGGHDDRGGTTISTFGIATVPHAAAALQRRTPLRWSCTVFGIRAPSSK
jgi:hypothetical protein